MKRTCKDRGLVYSIRQPVWIIESPDDGVDSFTFSTKKYAVKYLREVIGLKVVKWDTPTLAYGYWKRSKDIDFDNRFVLYQRWLCIRFKKEEANGKTGV